MCANKFISAENENENTGHYIAGFVDGEGCFHIESSTRRNNRVYFRAKFIVSVRDDDVGILHEIQKTLGCGIVSRSKKEQKRRGFANPMCRFSVMNVEDLNKKIVPFFQKYFLRAKKSRDFSIWRKAVALLYKVKGKSKNGTGTERDRKELKRLNTKLRKTRVKSVTSQKFSELPQNIDSKSRNQTGHYIAGLTDAEGCFYLQLHKSENRPVSRMARFLISLREDDNQILYEMREFFRCGIVVTEKRKLKSANTRPQHGFVVSDVTELHTKIVPFFQKYFLRAKKSKDFAIWKKAVVLLYKIKMAKRKRWGAKKWRDEDNSEFERLYIKLKKIRLYRECTPLPTV
jgi:hypothetical protein